MVSGCFGQLCVPVAGRIAVVMARVQLFVTFTLQISYPGVKYGAPPPGRPIELRSAAAEKIEL